MDERNVAQKFEAGAVVMKKLVCAVPLLLCVSIFQGCSSDKLQDVHYVSSDALKAPIPHFNIVLENQGNNDVDVAFTLTFINQEANEFFGENYDFGEALGEPIRETIRPHKEITFSTVIEGDIPDDLFEKMTEFDLTLYHYEDTEQVGERVIEVRESFNQNEISLRGGDHILRSYYMTFIRFPTYR